MKVQVHPLQKRRNITIQFNTNPQDKKLRRLPHIFSRVLELPFRSDAEVEVEESIDCFRFTAEAENCEDVRTHTVEIHPGVIKIVVRTNGEVEISSLELDMWRFRLPETTLPELASAVFVDGELVVTVPKGENGILQNNNGNVGTNSNNMIVLVQ
ncbi:hypothetical protein ACFE04_011789 [Oxalis oulophora]